MKPADQLSDEELRIEIAEFCGWKYPCSSCFNNGYEDRWRTPDDHGCVSKEDLPNYPQDLNAMWEAESKLDHSFWIYEKFLAENFRPVHATAKQRAIAFIKTIREIKR